MIKGGLCDYGGDGNQLTAAVSFLQAHAGQVALVTLDIGANDVDGCVTVSPLNIDQECIQRGVGCVSSNLPWILRRLRTAAGNTPIVAMKSYNPFPGGLRTRSSRTGGSLRIPAGNDGV